ncbi:hypothetical protein [Shewanella sp. Shew256]|uniref:hypothetical protein n=1 Tax=Shewanella sp. Shew256 TaxID=1969376 RepID=UPI000B49DA3E|nr:hypothetical protein [Shewanella sp. Shew256]
MNTYLVAEHMLSTGRHYTAAQLGAELGISAIEASAKLWNVRNSQKYQCECTNLPNRTVKVLAIKGRVNSKKALWDLVLFNKPIIKEAP